MENIEIAFGGEHYAFFVSHVCLLCTLNHGEMLRTRFLGSSRKQCSKPLLPRYLLQLRLWLLRKRCTRGEGRPLDRAIYFSNISIQSSGLYDFQESAILFLELPDDIYDQDHGFKRRFLNLAPGLGKTVVERHFISSKPKGYKVLFLVPSGLVEQTAELLSAHSSTQRHLCVKGANNCQEYLDALQAQPDVLVLNVSLKADYASYYWKFNLVVVDEAQKRLGFCAKLAKSLKCDLHFLSGSALTWFHIPFSVPVFRFDKTPTVIEQAMLASVKINVAPIATEDSHLTDYLDALGRMLTEHSPEVASSLFFLLLSATEKHPQLNRVWTQPMRRNFASGVLACFGMTVEKWRSKRTSFAQLRPIRMHSSLGEAYINVSGDKHCPVLSRSRSHGPFGSSPSEDY